MHTIVRYYTSNLVYFQSIDPMRNFLIAVVLFACCTPVFAQWQRIETPFQPFRISAVDSATLWCMTSGTPRIARTSDGGVTWQQYDLPASDGFLLTAFLSAIDSNVAWAAFRHYDPANNFVFRTQDKGQTWFLRTPPGLHSGQVVSFMKFYNADKGIVLSYNFEGQAFVYRTSDGGLNWTSQTLQIDGAFLNATAYGDQHIWFYTASGELWRSADGGENWAAFPSGLVSPFYGLAMEFADSLHGLAFKEHVSNELYRTSDGGASWHAITDTVNALSPDVFVWGISSIPDLPGSWVVGYNDGTAFSHDDGENWIPELDYPDYDFNKAEFLNHRQGWGFANGEFAVFKWEMPVENLERNCVHFTGPLTGQLRRSDCAQIWLDGSIPADISEDQGIHIRVNLSYPGQPGQEQVYNNLRTGCTDCALEFVPDPGQTTTGNVHFSVRVLFPYDTTQTIVCTVSPTACPADTAHTYSFQPGYFANWFHPECFALDSSNCGIRLLTNVCGNDTNQYKIYYRVQNGPAVLGSFYEKNPSYYELVTFYVFADGDYESSTCYEAFSTLYSCGVSGTPAPPVSDEPVLSIAPNPATDAFQIFCDNLPERENCVIRIRNTAGVVVWSQALPQGVSSLFVENAALPAGFYVTELWAEEQMLSVKKLVVTAKG